MFVQQHCFQQSLHQMMNSGFRCGFRAESSLPLAQSTPAVTHDTTRLYSIGITLWDCHIHTDAVRVLSWILFMCFLLSDGESPKLVKNVEVELVIKPWHPPSIGNTLIIQQFSMHFSCIFSYFSNLC